MIPVLAFRHEKANSCLQIRSSPFFHLGWKHFFFDIGCEHFWLFYGWDSESGKHFDAFLEVGLGRDAEVYLVMSVSKIIQINSFENLLGLRWLFDSNQNKWFRKIAVNKSFLHFDDSLNLIFDLLKALFDTHVDQEALDRHTLGAGVES